MLLFYLSWYYTFRAKLPYSQLVMWQKCLWQNACSKDVYNKDAYTESDFIPKII